MRSPGRWTTTLAALVALVWMIASALDAQRPWDGARSAGFAMGVVFLSLVFVRDCN